MSPYREALTWIEKHPGTGGSNSLAKLVLSLWNGDCAFSFRECVSNLDEPRTALALRMVAHFAERGEDSDLVAVGRRVCDLCPRLWDLGEAASRAKAETERNWGEQSKSAC